MKNLRYIFFVLALSFVVQINAQQDPHFSLYRYNMSVINPAYAGTSDDLEALFGVRSQWARVQDAPETFNFNTNSPLRKNMGIGLTVVGDKVFVISETHVYADFSYKLTLSDDLDLYAGLKAGGSFLNIDLDGLVDNDPLFTENVNNFNPNVGIGFYLRAEKYYVTVSAPGLLKNDRFEKEGVVPVSANDNIHFFTGAGYEFGLGDNYTLTPSAMARFVYGAPVSIDITASFMYKKRLELGINYRLDESYTGFLTMEFLDRLRIGYAFERTTTEINNYNNGSHEIILKLLLGNKKRITEIKL